jgi:hypothetical protein
MKRNYYRVIFFCVACVAMLGCKNSYDTVLTERKGKIIHVTTTDELQQALLNVNPHETILIADGVYNLKQPLMVENKEHFTLRGASGNPANVVLQGGGWEGGNPRDGIVIRSSNDVVIADLSIIECRNFGVKIEALGNELFPMSPKNIQIIGCNFMNIGVRAIKGTAPANRQLLEGGLIRFCHFENTKIPDTTWQFRGDYVSAIDMMFLKDWTISDNTFYNIKGVHGGGRGAVFIWNQSRNVVVERNVFVGCDRSIAFGNPSEPTHYEQGTLHNYDGIIRNNFIVAGSSRGKGIEIVWADNVQVCHNTVFSPDLKYRAIDYFQKIRGLRVANNLVQGLILGEGDALLEGNLAGALDGYFISPAAGNLHLTVRALEAIGKGIPGSCALDDIDGQKRKSVPDIGADEFSNADIGTSNK